MLVSVEVDPLLLLYVTVNHHLLENDLVLAVHFPPEMRFYDVEPESLSHPYEIIEELGSVPGLLFLRPSEVQSTRVVLSVSKNLPVVELEVSPHKVETPKHFDPHQFLVMVHSADFNTRHRPAPLHFRMGVRVKVHKIERSNTILNDLVALKNEHRQSTSEALSAIDRILASDDDPPF